MSIETILALTMVGAKAYTYDVLEKGLVLGNASKATVANEFQAILQPAQNNPQLTMANAIYIEKDYQVRPSFLQTAVTKFYSNVSNIDFGRSEAAADTINNWVSSETHGKISSIVTKKSVRGSKMVLVNAIYFKGKWEHPFSKRSTYKQMFNYGTCDNTNATQEKIDMMHNQVNG